MTRVSRLALTTYRALPISPARRQQLKHFLFAAFGFAFVRLEAYEKWKAYRQIHAGWPATDSAGQTTPRTAGTPRTIVPPQSADGIWEWADYDAVRSRISQIKDRQLSQVTPAPLDVIDIRNEPFESVAARLELPALPVDPEVSIILPAFNQLKLTLECLLSIAADPDSRISFEIILADDASTDATPEIAGRIANLRIVRNERNLGFLRNCNRALEHVRGRYVVYLNNDVQVTAGWLAHLHQTFASQPNVGAAGPRFVYPSGHLQEAGVAFRHDGTADMVGLNDDSARPRYNYIRRVDYISGACLMLPAGLARQLGGFSEEFLPCYFEDSDLCLRVQGAGYHVYYNPASTITHHLSKTTAAFDSDFKLRSISANLVTLQQKWQEHFEVAATPRTIVFYVIQSSQVPPAAANGSSPGDRPIPDRKQQPADLARRYGIHGFCFYCHGSGGRDLPEHPIESMLASTPDMPFCLCWTDEDRARPGDRDADGAASRRHSSGDDEAAINDLIRYFRDPRYIRIDGRPLMVVQQGTLSPDFAATVERWRTICRQQGAGEIYVAVLESGAMRTSRHPSELACDATVEFPAPRPAEQTAPAGEGRNTDGAGAAPDYRDHAVRHATSDLPGYTRFRCVIPGWHDTARQTNQSFCLTRATPGAFQAWLEEAIEQTRQQHYGDERLVFIHAWNDWANGAHLEPDRRFGHTYLEAVKNAVESAALLRAPRNWHGG